MGYILGLDLGSNSIGWACIDPEKKQIIVHGDGTPVVYLYFLNRKGVSVDLHSISSAKFDQYRVAGFEYIVSQQKPEKISILKNIDYETVSSIGDFHVIKLL